MIKRLGFDPFFFLYMMIETEIKEAFCKLFIKFDGNIDIISARLELLLLDYDFIEPSVSISSFIKRGEIMFNIGIHHYTKENHQYLFTDFVEVSETRLKQYIHEGIRRIQLQDFYRRY